MFTTPTPFRVPPAGACTVTVAQKLSFFITEYSRRVVIAPGRLTTKWLAEAGLTKYVRALSASVTALVEISCVT